MNPALAAIAAVTIGGGVLAVSARDVRATVLGLLVVLLAVFADQIAPYPYDHAISGARMKPPSARHWMGTDNLARDIWSRVVYGARISVTVGFATVTLVIVLATAIGVTSAYIGGAFDIVVQRVVDAVAKRVQV